MNSFEQIMEVNGGFIKKYYEIDVKENRIQFVGQDPQIHVLFDEPTQDIRIYWKTGIGSFEKTLSTIYYQYGNEGYSEAKTCRIWFECMSEKVKEIHFEKKIQSLRFNPVDFCGECEVETIRIESIKDSSIENSISKCICGNENDEKVVILTHELSATGAPILAYHISNELKQKGKNVVVLTRHQGDGFLREKFLNSNIPLIDLENQTENFYEYFSVRENQSFSGIDNTQYMKNVFKVLRDQGFNTVIANTIVSGLYVEMLKDYNFKVISLIHEMKTTIEMYGFLNMGKNVADYADYIVFPNDTVKKDFESLYDRIKGKCVIRPQGVYLKDEGQLSKNAFREYGIEEKDFVVMSSGTCELRKGVDLFVNAALIFSDICEQDNIKFIWTGEFHNKELEGWLKNQLERAQIMDKVRFIPFIKEPAEYRKLLNRADVFWAMSREDPFPSTVLEAMKESVPVVGFSGTGGIEVMLCEHRGILVNNYNVAKIACETKNILLNSNDMYKLMIDNAKEYVTQLDFQSYVQFLLECTEMEQVIYPGLDCYKWNWNHYWSKQLPDKTMEEKKRQLNKAIWHKKAYHQKAAKGKIALLDTSIGSDNVGDSIIMDYCIKACDKILKDKEVINIPTHIYEDRAENIEHYFKILCGTNLIYKRMEDSVQWQLPDNLNSYSNICLLGVGMQHIDLKLPMSDYSKKLLRFMLSSRCIHSVRDEETKNCLQKIGIKNVLNTGCPTMWALTPEFCNEIPREKGENVLTTVTDYLPDSEKDSLMLKLLKESYKEVYIWIQGQKDYEYLKTIIDINQYLLIPPSLQELDVVLEKKKLDYVGTRLHAGIRSLNYGHRSIVISIDNRAKTIAKDTDLPILERERISDKLKTFIETDFSTNIHIPMDRIEQWKSQFH